MRKRTVLLGSGRWLWWMLVGVDPGGWPELPSGGLVVGPSFCCMLVLVGAGYEGERKKMKERKRNEKKE